MTKDITSNDIKTVVNTIKTEESISDEGEKDNNASNDYSEASLIISIKTGNLVQYIFFIIVLTMIVAISLYEINKKVLKG